MSILTEKEWKDLTDNEKIERMRGIVKELQSIVCRQRALIEELYEHNHNEKGELIIKLSMYGGSVSSEKSIGSIREYF